MNKAPAIMLYVNDWSRDMEEHPLEIEGAWIRICCKLKWSDTPGEMTKSLIQWSRILHQTEEKTMVILTYLFEEDIATFPLGNPKTNGNTNGKIIIISRRMLRDEKDKKNNRLRQKKHYDKHNNNTEPNGVPNANLTVASSITPSITTTITTTKENKIPSVEGGKKIKKLDDGSYCYTIKKMVKNKEKNTNYYFSKFDAGMAKLLSESIIKNYPNHKKEKDDKLAAWANQCRLLRTDEERPLEEVDIERVLRWSQKSTFWYKNICCMEKFRDKYEELDMKSQEIKSYQQQSNPAAINTDEIDYKGELDPENNPKHIIFS